MLKKTTASVGLAVAASAGVLLFTGSSASAQTAPVSAKSTPAYVQTTMTSTEHLSTEHPSLGHQSAGQQPIGHYWGHPRDDLWGHGWGHHWNGHWGHHRQWHQHGHQHGHQQGHHGHFQQHGWKGHHTSGISTHRIETSSGTVIKVTVRN